MFRVDEAIVQHLRLLKSRGRKGQMGQQRAALHFRQRLIELIELYVKHESSNPLVLEIIPHVIQVGGAGGRPVVTGGPPIDAHVLCSLFAFVLGQASEHAASAGKEGSLVVTRLRSLLKDRLAVGQRQVA